MDCSMPGFPVHHQLPELAQTHVHWVGDAIQPSHPLFSPSPPAFNLSQHQSLFKWISSSHQVAKVLEFQLQYQSFQWTLRIDLLQDGLVGFFIRSHQSLSRVWLFATPWIAARQVSLSITYFRIFHIYICVCVCVCARACTYIYTYIIGFSSFNFYSIYNLFCCTPWKKSYDQPR